MDQITHDVRRANWLSIITECQQRPMNVTTKQWLADNGIDDKAYYYWLRKFRRESSAIIYSIAETAKANNLKPYNYFEYLLTEIPKHMDDHNTDFCEDLLPWSDKLPAECRKQL